MPDCPHTQDGSTEPAPAPTLSPRRSNPGINRLARPHKSSPCFIVSGSTAQRPHGARSPSSAGCGSFHHCACAAVRSILLMILYAVLLRQPQDGFCFVGRAWALWLFSPASGEPLVCIVLYAPPMWMWWATREVNEFRPRFCGAASPENRPFVLATPRSFSER